MERAGEALAACRHGLIILRSQLTGQRSSSCFGRCFSLNLIHDNCLDEVERAVSSYIRGHGLKNTRPHRCLAARPFIIAPTKVIKSNVSMQDVDEASVVVLYLSHMKADSCPDIRSSSHVSVLATNTREATPALEVSLQPYESNLQPVCLVVFRDRCHEMFGRACRRPRHQSRPLQAISTAEFWGQCLARRRLLRSGDGLLR